jgi:hypothetical protein
MSATRVENGSGRPLQEASKKPPRPSGSRRPSGEFERMASNGAEAYGADRGGQNGSVQSDGKEAGHDAGANEEIKSPDMLGSGEF